MSTGSVNTKSWHVQMKVAWLESPDPRDSETNQHRLLSLWVMANIEDCDQDSLKTVSVPVNVTIDNGPPVPACAFQAGEHVDETGSRVPTDPKLTCSVAENCQTSVEVQVAGFSNEKEDFNAQVSDLLQSFRGVLKR